MRLKSLDVQGFKSFAEKTTITFGEGITGIVGPNGSGKSNISDAIRWVMGEQSAKSLRSGNMQEVIFAGTQKRKPLGFAEVTLTIDNSDHGLPIEYDEVTITRRVFRSGESEYFINKSSVRLRDIHELFMDTGVGRDGYSMIGQGKIAEIISAKSDDRRQMFEEASGITKFRYRKEEAERKLAHTNDNILRVNDIISELENQVEPLRIQSEKAKKFLNLREELKVVEVNVSLESIEKYKKSLLEVEKIYNDIANSLAEIEASASGIEKEIELMFKSISENEKETEEKRQKQQMQSDVLSEYRKDIALLESKIQHNSESKERIEQEIKVLKEKLSELLNTDESSNVYYIGLTDKKDAYDNKITELEKQLSELDVISESKNSEIEEINADLIERLNKISTVTGKISNYKALISGFLNRAEVIDKELSEKNVSYEEIRGNISKAEKEYKNLGEEIKNYSDKLDNLTDKRNKVLKKNADIQNKLLLARTELGNAVSRKRVLTELENSFDNYSKSVKAVMLAHRNNQLKGVEIYGTVASLLTVDKKYSAAIDIALGAGVQNIVTKTEDDAKRAIEYLKNTKSGRATFLPVSSAKCEKTENTRIKTFKGFIGIASDLVKFDKKFEGVINNLLSRTAVVDNIDNAVIMAKSLGYKQKIVTLDGDLLSPGGSMTGGSRNHTAGIFERVGEIQELAEKIKELTLLSEKLGKEFLDKEKESSDIDGEIAEIKTILDEKQGEYIKKSSDIKYSKTFLKSVEDARTAIITERRQIDSQVEKMNVEIKSSEEEIAKIREEISDLEKRTALEKEGVSDIISKRDRISEELVEVRMSLNTVKKDIEVHNERMAELYGRKGEIERDIERKNKDIDAIYQLNSDIQDDIEFKNSQIEDISEEIKEIIEELSKNDTQRKETHDKIQEKQNELKKVREQQMALQQQQGKAESRKTKAESDLDNTISRLWDEYELTITTAEEYRTDVGSYTSAQKRISELKNQIKSLGNINIDSIEEYKNVKERYDFLTTQRDDLVSARHNLETVISDMTEIMKKQFEEKFKVINKHFGEVFVELFGGGKAQLKLTEPDDVLSSGVEIDVHPPGKSIKNMLQLSGGEQAFVSIALLFAILKVRPAPFCILDEIEAALDDVNVYRFAEYLKGFTEFSQFIVVTHRRGTMEAANILYGVTMQEQGVTKLLSMNIDEVVKEK